MATYHVIIIMIWMKSEGTHCHIVLLIYLIISTNDITTVMAVISVV